MDKKRSGSYYTPSRLSSFVADYCLAYLRGRNDISILEPSAGDGSFVDAFSNSQYITDFDSVSVVAVEKEEKELEKLLEKEIHTNIELTTFNSDYLNFHSDDQRLFTAVIGNPPYVRKNHLSENQKEIAQSIHAQYQLSANSINNIWTSFLISGVSKLEDSGLLAMILPLELLQVKFTEEIRSFLKQEFQRIEIFTFHELQFQECKGQDTVLLIGYVQHNIPGTFYTNINTIDDLLDGNYTLYQNTAVSDSQRKWTHHFITPSEYEFLEGIRNRLNKVSFFVDNKAGIVTAANDFFIVPQQTVEEYNLHDYTRAIVQKGYFVNGSVTFNNQDFERILQSDKPAYLLDFTPMEDNAITPSIAKYLQIGVKAEIPTRFKCLQRERWYKVPNIGTACSAFFFKRAHEYPKLILNEADILVTDSAYKIDVKEGIDIRNFIFSFYNSLTLVFAELEGRYYGGGVLELTPNEFRELPIPYVECEDFIKYEMHFDEKESIEDILMRYNYQILNDALGLNQDDIERIEAIRIKLIKKRHRK